MISSSSRVETTPEIPQAAWKRERVWPQAHHYTYQEGEGGIADALRLAEFFADKDKICVVLGDNIIEKNIRKAAEAFAAQKEGAKILLKKSPIRHGSGFLN